MEKYLLEMEFDGVTCHRNGCQNEYQIRYFIQGRGNAETCAAIQVCDDCHAGLIEDLRKAQKKMDGVIDDGVG